MHEVKIMNTMRKCCGTHAVTHGVRTQLAERTHHQEAQRTSEDCYLLQLTKPTPPQSRICRRLKDSLEVFSWAPLQQNKRAVESSASICTA